MKRVLLLTTGGTIAARPGDMGLAPQVASSSLLGYVSELSNHYEIEARDILSMDSSNIQAEEWQTIARAVYEELDRYDGIVITHGTDTMAYTASMLSYMLRNLKKPVVLTGSQMPIENLLTDARNNLSTAFAAVDADIPGVSIAFNHKIINGCRAVKVRTMGFEAFESVNAPCLAEVYANGLHKTGALPVHPRPVTADTAERPALHRCVSSEADSGHQSGCAQDADGNAVQGHCVGDLWRRRDALPPPQPAAGTAKADGPRRLHRGLQPVSV